MLQRTIVGRPVADERLHGSEGFGFERLVGQLYEERSRRGLGDFALTRRIQGYWDRAGTEIDLVALNEDDKVIRFGTCKRSASRLVSDLKSFDSHIERFLNAHPTYRAWTTEKVALAPVVSDGVRSAVRERGYFVQDLSDLTTDLD